MDNTDKYKPVTVNDLGPKNVRAFISVASDRVFINAHAARRYGLKPGDRFRFLRHESGRDWALERTEGEDAFLARRLNGFGALRLGGPRLSRYLTKVLGDPLPPFRIALGEDDGARITMITGKYIQR